MTSNYLQKIKVIEDSNLNNKDIESWYKNRIWHRKMCQAKSGKKTKSEGIELPN